MIKINKILRRITVAVIGSAFVFQSVFASVLGSTWISGYTIPIGHGSEFSHNVFYSDQEGVGKQTENYFTYTPNENVKPFLAYSEYVYGRKNIYEVIDYATKNGVNLIGGINSDYFSFKTGVPMSDAVVNGKILTKDLSGKDAIGFRADGSAFIAWIEITSDLYTNTQDIVVHHINKHRQPYSVYLFDENFADTTKAETRGLNVVIDPQEGDMVLGGVIKGVIESKEITDGDFTIPKGKLVISVDCSAPSEIYEPINNLIEGEEITMAFNVNDEIWKDTVLIAGSVGGRLLIDGAVNPNLEKGAAPRSAVGVRADGSTVFYTIDGRLTNHSYGVQLKTLAERMKELGCVDALNLDGGGSTSIAIKYPGTSSLELVNRPSDGSVRKNSNFLFLRNVQNPTGVLGGLYFTDPEPKVLTNASVDLDVYAVDSNFYAMELPQQPEYSVADGFLSTIDQNGVFTARETGYVTVNAKVGDVVGSINVLCLSEPTNIMVLNQETREEISELTIKPGGVFDFTATAYGGYNEFTAQDTAFEWSVDGNIGQIDENGTFTAANAPGAVGVIKVKSGNVEKYVRVSIENAEVDVDPNNYPEITLSISDEILTAKILTGYNIPINSENIHLKIDGREVVHQYNAEENIVTYTINKENFVNERHRITLYATNTLGYSGYGVLETASETELDSAFADTEGHWANGVLSYMSESGIINGEIVDGKSFFRPDKAMTRAEFAVMVSRYLGINADDYKNIELPFSDKDLIPTWAINNFKAMYSLGIIQGRYVDGITIMADPLGELSRAEAVTIISRTLPDGFKSVYTQFIDENQIPSWSKTGFSKLISLGAIGGYSDGSLKPLRFLSKAEAVKILYNIF